MQDDVDRGLTIVQTSVLAGAVEDEVEALPGGSGTVAVLRGTARQPELTLKVTANDRTDLPALLNRIETEVAAHLAAALDTPVHRLAVQLDVTAAKRTSDSVTL